MSWREKLKSDPIPWLVEHDNPGVRYLAMQDLLDTPADDPKFLETRQLAHSHGPIAEILEQMDPEGWWDQPGAGYFSKYRSIVWSLVNLAQLGASVVVDERIATACRYLLEHTYTPGGQFGAGGTPSSTADCLQGNLCWALVVLGYDDPRLEKAYEWMARSVTGEGVAPINDKKAELRYYAGKCGPTFACGSNNKLPCAWGAIKVMLAFSVLPLERYTPLIEQAVQQGIDFLFEGDPLASNYPNGWADKPSGNWWKFGFPVFYITDMLQNVECLVRLGYGRDPRLKPALDYIRNKQDSQGLWALEYDYAGKMWVDFGAKKQPNPWVTLRALRVLKQAGTDEE